MCAQRPSFRTRGAAALRLSHRRAVPEIGLEQEHVAVGRGLAHLLQRAVDVGVVPPPRLFGGWKFDQHGKRRPPVAFQWRYLAADAEVSAAELLDRREDLLAISIHERRIGDFLDVEEEVRGHGW